MNAADILTLLDPATQDTWPQGILATGDLRVLRANLINEGGPGIWYVGPDHTINGPDYLIATVEDIYGGRLTEHIAAEANPAHALAAVRRWRGVVKRHVRESAEIEVSVCAHCVMSGPDGYVWGVESWPCPDLTETADEARAYLGGAS